MALTYPTAVHEQQNGQWVDLTFDLAENASVIAPVDETQTYSFAKISVPGEALVDMYCENTQLKWSISATSGSQEGVSLSTGVNAKVAGSQEIALDQAQKLQAANDMVSQRETLRERVAQAKTQVLSKQEKNSDLTLLNEQIDAYNNEKMSQASPGVSTVTYPDALGAGIDLRYTASKGRIKEDMRS